MSIPNVKAFTNSLARAEMIVPEKLPGWVYGIVYLFWILVGIAIGAWIWR